MWLNTYQQVLKRTIERTKEGASILFHARDTHAEDQVPRDATMIFFMIEHAASRLESCNDIYVDERHAITPGCLISWSPWRV